jgi:hypothetical protein
MNVLELFVIAGGVFVLLFTIAYAVKIYYNLMKAHFDPIIKHYYEKDTKKPN